MTFDSLEALFEYAKRPRYAYEDGYIVDADNLPPRKWADGKMHEKVAGKWRVVKQENKKFICGEKEEQKSYINSSYENIEIDIVVDNVNPNYEKGGFQFQNNCSRCCATYDAKRKGIKCTVKPTPARNVEELPADIFSDYDDNGFSKMYENANVLETKGSGLLEIKHFLNKSKNGTRLSVVGMFKDFSCHNFIAEKINDEIVFINPQNSKEKYYNEKIFDLFLPNATKFFDVTNLKFNFYSDFCFEKE